MKLNPTHYQAAHFKDEAQQETFLKGGFPIDNICLFLCFPFAD